MSTTDIIEREAVVDAPVERVWAMLTEAEHLGRWFADAGAEIELRPGGLIELRWTEHGTVRGRVEDVVPGRLLALRWAPYQDPGGSEPTDGNSTRIRFSLEPAGEGTRVRVVESGFDTLDCAPQQRAANRAGNSEGWDIELGHLREHAVRQAV